MRPCINLEQETVLRLFAWLVLSASLLCHLLRKFHHLPRSEERLNSVRLWITFAGICLHPSRCAQLTPRRREERGKKKMKSKKAKMNSIPGTPQTAPSQRCLKRFIPFLNLKFLVQIEATFRYHDIRGRGRQFESEMEGEIKEVNWNWVGRNNTGVTLVMYQYVRDRNRSSLIDLRQVATNRRCKSSVTTKRVIYCKVSR